MNKIVNGVANDYEYDFLDNIARDYIEKHTTHIKGYTEEYVNKLNKEIDRLNNVINELEKYINKLIGQTRTAIAFNKGINDVYETKKYERDNDLFEMVLDKLKELKENRDEG